MGRKMSGRPMYNNNFSQLNVIHQTWCYVCVLYKGPKIKREGERKWRERRCAMPVVIIIIIIITPTSSQRRERVSPQIEMLFFLFGGRKGISIFLFVPAPKNDETKWRFAFISNGTKEKITRKAWAPNWVNGVKKKNRWWHEQFLVG